MVRKELPPAPEICAEIDAMDLAQVRAYRQTGINNRKNGYALDREKKLEKEQAARERDEDLKHKKKMFWATVAGVFVAVVAVVVGGAGIWFAYINYLT